MSKTKFRSLGIGFFLSAVALILAMFIWPFVPSSIKTQLNELNLPLVAEGQSIAKESSKASEPVAESSSSSVATSESKTESQASSSAPKETTENVALKDYTINVEPGAISSQIANELEENGVISSSDAFYDYLIKEGISENILTGQFQLTKGMTFEEIAKAIGAK